MKHVIKIDEAVSPVVGVMLMLVVTIIIAAVVSGFAGGLAGDTNKAPQASIVAKAIVANEAYDADNSNGVPDVVSGNCSDVYVVFEHKGGDGLNLNNIEIYLGSVKYPSEKSVVSNAKSVNSTTASTGTKANIVSSFSKNWTVYLEDFPGKTSIISTGSQFVLHADYVRDETNRGGSYPKIKKISWEPVGAVGAYSVETGDYLSYDIIDKTSKKSISSGQILVPDFGVKSS